MKSLAEWAGIAIEWNASGDEILFDQALAVKETKSRLRKKLRPVLPDDEACAPADAIQYWMYNGISLPEHAQAFTDLNIQYELTLLYPAKLGRERSKTLGHIHSFPPNSSLNYAEVCEVLWGEALFVLQTLDVESASSSFCYAVHAKQGDKVILPPNTHHLTINPRDDEMLLFSDLIGLDVKGVYDGLSSMQGAAYLYGESGWFANPIYASAAPLHIYEAESYPDVGLAPDVPLYELIWRDPELLRWVANPTLFDATFPALAKQVAPIFDELER